MNWPFPTNEQYKRMVDEYHEKIPTKKPTSDDKKEVLLTACKLAIRLNDIDRIKDVLRFAIEATEK